MMDDGAGRYVILPRQSHTPDDAPNRDSFSDVGCFGAFCYDTFTKPRSTNLYNDTLHH